MTRKAKQLSRKRKRKSFAETMEHPQQGDVGLPKNWGTVRKRKGRSKPLPKACIPQPMEGEQEPMPLPRQRGPTSPPSGKYVCGCGEVIGGGMNFLLTKRKPFRPFADQQLCILSQMEREDWRPKQEQAAQIQTFSIG